MARRQYANPQLEFFAGLPGYAGFQSFVTIPFTDVGVGVGAVSTAAQLTSPAPTRSSTAAWTRSR